MKPALPKSLLILKKACKKFSYSWKLIDDYSNNLVEVSALNEHFFSSSASVGLYPLNTKFSAQLVRDKAWTNQVLKQRDYQVPAGEYFFLKKEFSCARGQGRELEDAFIFAQDRYPVFVKPNNASRGLLSEIVNNKKELKDHLQRIAEICPIALIQEVINLPEYRIFAVDGQVKFVYQRLAPKVIGDGISSLTTLIARINKQIKNKQDKISLQSVFLRQQLKKYNLSLNSIPKLGQKIRISPKTNISAGGNIQNYSEDVSPETKEWTKKLMSALALRVGGIDIFVPRSINHPQDFIIIEVNCNPGLSGIYQLGYQDKVMEIWQEILIKYFKK